MRSPGEPPLYPLVDSMSYSPGDAMWKDAMDDIVDVALEEPHKGEPFFDLPLKAARRSLSTPHGI